ncbi:hypothetical protein [Marinilabilia rubra]|uniref:Uncharacterized protein n=1 Tax=Marinilabilia rubra TaxID=2162893 RepID=A0A2U2B364_9BACT|nr:hypothetical protein [Marinilabilia rubra]PWD97477.1 hypothetical protein DDZ16_20570 [Marinilabilia rubra]
MKLYAKCPKCKSEISFTKWVSDRIEFKKSNGEYISLTCKNCNKKTKFHIVNIEAKENKIAHFIALSVLLIGTSLLLIFLWDFLFLTINIYTIAGLLSILVVPSIIFGIITKNERKRVRLFNYS